MRFNSVGTFEVTIMEALISDPKFSEEAGAFDICLRVQDAEEHEDWWRGEVSGDYGVGNFADQTRAQSTAKTLKTIGFEHGLDLTKLDTLVGMKTTATTKTKDDKFFNISYLGGGDSPKAVDPNSIAEKMKYMAQFFPKDEGGAATTTAAAATTVVDKAPADAKSVTPASEDDNDPFAD